MISFNNVLPYGRRKICSKLIRPNNERVEKTAVLKSRPEAATRSDILCYILSAKSWGILKGDVCACGNHAC